MIIIVSSDHAAESVKEKEKARPEIQTIIENFFGGRLQITVRCHSCSKDSIREDYFTHLGWNREILEQILVQITGKMSLRVGYLINRYMLCLSGCLLVSLFVCLFVCLLVSKKQLNQLGPHMTQGKVYEYSEFQKVQKVIKSANVFVFVLFYIVLREDAHR